MGWSPCKIYKEKRYYLLKPFEMKVLITVPNLKLPGGVTALFNILKMEMYYSNISLFILHSKLPSILRIPLKYIEFILILKHVDLVHLNPSLNRKSFYRDAIFAWLTIFFSRKLIVYWHGWDEDYESKISKSRLLNFIIKHSFLKAHASIVLGSVFENKLKGLGYRNKVYIETNTAENKYIVDKLHKNISKVDLIRLLFLSRLEIEKGVYIAIETLKLLNKHKKRFILVIAGTGNEEENIKHLIAQNDGIEWVGYVTGLSKHNLLMTSHIMFFPSYYPEGLPLTLLEAMIYGLPIVSRPVGGIPDIIINEENGYLIENLEPNDYAEKIDTIVNKPGVYTQMSKNNIEKSMLFSPELVRERIYNFYESVYHGE